MIWLYQTRISSQLFAWSALSVFGGVALLLLVLDPFWRGVGLQGVVWGAIDAGIAFFGQLGMRRKLADVPDPNDRGVQLEEARRLQRLLFINAGLDVLYVAVGVGIVLTFGVDNTFARGNGVGIVVQGAFLLLFDLFHGWRSGKVAV